MTEEEKAAAEAAAKEAAEKAAADKAKADQEAADKAAADKAAADAVAASAAGNEELTAAQAEIARLQAIADKFAGLDPEAARKAIADAEVATKAAAEAEKEKLKAEGNFEKLREMQAAEAEAAIKAAQEAKEAAIAEAKAAREELVKAKVETAFANSTFLQAETILPAPHAQRLYGDHVEVENGVVIVYDKPAGADKRAKIMDSKGNALPFNDAIAKLIEADPAKDSLLKTKTVPGAASTTTDGKPGTGEKTRHERIREGLAAMRSR